jgi:HAD superfamily hydrolase (TIGR01509 family)
MMTLAAAVILDMDGLMIDSEPVAYRAWSQAAVEIGYDLSPELYESFIGRRDADFDQELVGRYGEHFPLATFRELRSRLWQQIVKTEGLATKSGLGELLEFCQARRIQVGIATSSEHSSALRKLSAARIDYSFSTLVAAEDVRRGKPEPDIYLTAAERMGVKPEGCIVFEDSNAGVLAAASAGMVALMVPDMSVPSEPARAVAYAVLDSLRDGIPVLERLCSSAEFR